MPTKRKRYELPPASIPTIFIFIHPPHLPSPPLPCSIS